MVLLDLPSADSRRQPAEPAAHADREFNMQACACAFCACRLADDSEILSLLHQRRQIEQPAGDLDNFYVKQRLAAVETLVWQ